MGAETDMNEEYANPALKKIQKALKGNGIRAENITLRNFDGAILKYLALTQISCDAKLSEKTLAGRAIGQKIFQDRQEAHSEAQKYVANITKDPAACDQIITLIKQTPNNGFGLNSETIKLSSLNRDFTSHEPCNTCAGKGATLCPQCRGKGFEPCVNCNAQGFERCHECNGNRQTRGPNGDMQTCNLCQGLGKTSCSFCKENRQVQCSLCNTKGETQCKNCGGQGAQSHIIMAEISALCSFDYDANELPKNAVSTINDLGANLPDYADITPAENQEQDSEDGALRLFFTVKIPQANVEFALKDKLLKAYLFGKQGEVKDIPNFLDDALVSGANALSQAGSGQGNVIENIKKSIRYKTLKQAVIFASRYNSKKACKALIHYNPMGLSVNTAKQAIENANDALNHLTKQQRLIAMAAGAGSAVVLAALYAFSPLRPIIAGQVANPALHLPIHILALCLCGLAGYAVWQTIFSNARKQALNSIMAKK